MRRLIFILLLLPLLLPRVIRASLFADEMPTTTDLKQLVEPGKRLVSIRIDDHDRKFIFVTPTGFKPGESLPIVFFFHGAGGSAQQAARTYGWPEKAEKENFFAVFPQGLGVNPDGSGIFHVWRDERGNRPGGINDVHFFEVLLDKLQDAVPIDPRRIYVTGFSNGAGMSFSLGAHFSDRIAAIAPVSCQSFTKIDSLARPLPVYFLTGTADPLILYYGGKTSIPLIPFGKDYQYPPIQDTVDLWVRLDGCPPKPQVVEDEKGVHVLRYGPGRNGAEVLFTTIDGNGHHWPGKPEPLPSAIAGPSLDPFSATDRIWDFFKQHPLSK